MKRNELKRLIEQTINEELNQHEINKSYSTLLQSLSNFGKAFRSDKTILADWQKTKNECTKLIDSFLKSNNLND